MMVTSSQLPHPLVQGWVVFVSVFCFIGTTALLLLYLTGAHGGEASWVSLVSRIPGCLREWVVLDSLSWEAGFSSAGRAGFHLRGAGSWGLALAAREAAYHCLAVLLYSLSSVLEILATTYMQDGFTYERYLENISAVVSPPVNLRLFIAATAR
ncbi:hypothetical protein HPG69_011267 [Diceros bicornis minor]|uniref:Uncharacterized protein n=1 Tax=Diceros bicornis minor TaxID=77932 RepID=A0A7J7FDV8_DICBM|nr:hypothetical protein HPG69_011267 [Diceros bicornis minor]